ncbi:unnamed protein product, partial [Vitis vinifera]
MKNLFEKFASVRQFLPNSLKISPSSASASFAFTLISQLEAEASNNCF